MIYRESLEVKFVGLSDWWDAEGKTDGSIKATQGFLTVETQVDGDAITRDGKICKLREP